MKTWPYLILLFFAVTTSLTGQSGKGIFAEGNNSQIEKGLQFLDKNRNEYAQWLIKIGQIISPSGKEQERAEAVAKKMKEIGLEEVRVNDMPNAIGKISGKNEKAIIFISTLDDLAGVAEHQRKLNKPPYLEGNKIIGPGTNTSSTSVSILAAAQAILQSGKTPEHDLIFAAVAQEETGLKGMKHLFEEYRDKALIFVDVLGDGHRISYGALGIHWWKVVASGPPGHTLRGGRPDQPNVNQAIGRAIDQILQLEHPIIYDELRTRINVGMISSGNVFNHKPESGFFSLDIRSLDQKVIEEIETEVKKILREVSIQTKIQLKLEPFQIMNGGHIPDFEKSALVETAKAISERLGYEASLSNSGSSNMNVALSHSFPAIGLGGSRGGQRGFPDEWAYLDAMMNTAKFVFLYAFYAKN